MLPQWIIDHKRDGQTLTEEEIRFFIDGYDSGKIPDYQMSALAMAIYFKGMSFDEIAIMTDCMMRSGDVLDTSGIAMPTADKHSTGGIGDKVSLVLGPLAASCGVAVPMISGRGLGITGGTLDKMDAIPGYRTSVSSEEFLEIVGKCGCSIIGQTESLAPADKKLYALRDVTATVPTMSLIVPSIMSKKLAEGASSLVLDVKWGKGAFMKTQDDARELARCLVETGHRMGRGMVALITGMNEPLGYAAGNALEVIEAVETLRGNGPADLVEVTVALCEHMLVLAGRAASLEEAHEKLMENLNNGQALDVFKQMVALHGGDVAAIEDTSKLAQASIVEEIPAAGSGYVAEVDADAIGRSVILLGGGRKEVTDSIDYAVGISKLVKIGQTIEANQPLMQVHASDQASLDSARELLNKAVVISSDACQPEPLILETIRPVGS